MDITSILDSIKARNEERRKKKEDKMRKCTEEIRQKKINKTMVYSHTTTPKEPPLPPNPYMTKSRIEPVSMNSVPNYYTSY